MRRTRGRSQEISVLPSYRPLNTWRIENFVGVMKANPRKNSHQDQERQLATTILGRRHKGPCGTKRKQEDWSSPEDRDYDQCQRSGAKPHRQTRKKESTQRYVRDQITTSPLEGHVRSQEAPPTLQRRRQGAPLFRGL